MQHPAFPAVSDPLFRPPSDPEAAFVHPGWRQARAAALQGLRNGGVTVLLGPAGSGKSLLLRELARTLREAGQTARLIDWPGTAAEAFGATAGEVLLVDEADGLGAKALAVLCAGPGPVLLAALPGFAERRLADRLAGPPCGVLLGPLSPEDVARYVAARLAAGSRPRTLLEPEAVLALARHSGGLMRLVNTLGGTAVFLAGLEGAWPVTRRHVDEAAAMLDDIGQEEAMPSEVDVETVIGADVGAVPAEPASALPSPRRPVLRRRLVLGTAGAAAALIALPWLARGRLGRPLPAGDNHLRLDAALRAVPDEPAQAVAPAPGGSLPPAATPLAATPPAAVPPFAAPAVAVPPVAVPAAPEPVRHADTLPPAVPGADVLGAANSPVLFQGSIYNETMEQGGHLAVLIRRQALPGAVTARFDASQGLSGSGVLTGSLSDAGRIAVSGTLSMGRNAFICDLNGTIAAGRLTGTADFTRSGGAWAARSSFSLVRV